MVLVWSGSDIRPTCAIESRTELSNYQASSRLSLEESVGGDGDGHFPRFGVNEIRQRENHAVDDPADHGDDRQKAEQAGHVRASGGALTVKIIGGGRVQLPTCSPSRCKSLWQRCRRG